VTELNLHGLLDMEWINLTGPGYSRSDHVHVKSLRRQALDKEINKLRELIDDTESD